MSAAKAGHPNAMRVRVNSQIYTIPSRYLAATEFAYWVNPLLAGTQKKNRHPPAGAQRPLAQLKKGCETLARECGRIDFVSIQPVFFFQLSRKVFFRQVLKVFIGQGVQFIFEATG